MGGRDAPSDGERIAPSQLGSISHLTEPCWELPSSRRVPCWISPAGKELWQQLLTHLRVGSSGSEQHRSLRCWENSPGPAASRHLPIPRLRSAPARGMSDANKIPQESALRKSLEFFPALQQQSRAAAGAFTIPRWLPGFAVAGIGNWRMCRAGAFGILGAEFCRVLQ